MSQETQFRCCGDGRSLLGESLQKHLSARHIDQLVTQGKTVRVAKFVFFSFDWDSLHARLNSHYKASGWSVTRKRSTKRLKHTGNLFIKNLQLRGVC